MTFVVMHIIIINRRIVVGRLNVTMVMRKQLRIKRA